jgi:PIN like domain
MRVLLDECVPRKLGRALTGHEVLTVTGKGWSGVKNGRLLELAEAEFDVFLTVDQNLKYQQNLASFNIAVILLVARDNRLKTLLPLAPAVNKRLNEIKPGEFVRIGGS